MLAGPGRGMRLAWHPTSSSVQLAVDCTRAISLLSASCMSVVFREEKDQQGLQPQIFGY